NVDCLRSIGRPHRANPIECSEDAGVAWRGGSGRFEVALRITEVATSERQEGQPLECTWMGCVALQSGQPCGARTLVVTLIGQNPADEVVGCSERGVSGRTSLRDRQRG